MSCNFIDVTYAYANAVVEVFVYIFLRTLTLSYKSLSSSSSSLPLLLHRAPRGGAAQMLAQSLNAALKEAIAPRGPAQALFAVSALCACHCCMLESHVLCSLCVTIFL
jgi:NADH:ubiquinone oxidoreductase subunit H